MVKGIIFDKDGTLFSFKDFWVPIADKTVDYIIEKLKIPKLIKSEMIAEIGINDGINGVLCYGTYSQITKCFENVLKRHHIECAEIEKLTMDGFHSCVKYGKIVPLCENMSELFSKLKNDNYKIFLAITDDVYVTDKCLKELGISEYFDEVYADDGIHKCKPDPYYITQIFNNYNLKPDELVMVGDTMTDMKFAHNGNIKSIGVAMDEADKCVLRNDATMVIDNISQLVGVLNEF